jgi:hypothetical protein
MFNLKTIVTRACLAALLALSAGAALAIPGYHVSIDTSSLAGDGYLDLTLAALADAAPVTATLTNFTGNFGAAAFTQGAVDGGVDSTLSFTNGESFNELLQAITFGGHFGFDVYFDVASAGSVGSTFAVALVNAAMTDYVAGTGADFLVIGLLPGAAPTTTSATSLSSVSAVTAVPEPSSGILLASGLLLLAMYTRRGGGPRR